MTTTAGLAMDPPGGDYPVRFDVAYPESLNRWLIFVKWLLAIPHFIILYALGIVGLIIWFISFFAILFTGKYPESMFKFLVGVNRWQYNVGAYTSLMRDEYPPFSFDAGEYPVVFDVDYPQALNRWLVLIKWLLILPNEIVYLFVSLAAAIVGFIAWFAILFTGRYPRGLFDFAVGSMRWGARINGYSLFMTDEYPPFSLK